MQDIKTPSEFYRKLRPEYFSDSKKSYAVQLPREILAFELEKISTNQKQDAFETLCRRLAEKFIAPNLIPQVGPTGGGDGKTDFETYPISQKISEVWFVPEHGWDNEEKWAFAVSSKQDWKAKVKMDVEKILGTNREYTRIYFISNQYISSRKKKEYQDEVGVESGIELIILDCEWILEKIFNNDLISLVVDTMNLSQIYKNEYKDIGSRDKARTKELEETELKIQDITNNVGLGYQVVEYALESAILTRMLERPKDEVTGKFSRALRLAKKINNVQQVIRVHYQRAWTFINWYDDYENFLLDFQELKKLVISEPTIGNIELYFNLLNILRSVSVVLRNQNSDITIDVVFEESTYCDLLNTCITNKEKPVRALVAKSYKCFVNIFNSINSEQLLDESLNDLKQCYIDGEFYLEYPFSQFRELLGVIGETLPESKIYDEVVDVVAQISEKRISQTSSGEIFLKRAMQKLDKGLNKESIVYFGKSALKLAKSESQNDTRLALKGLYQAYLNLGLYYAAYNSILAVLSLSMKAWYNSGKLEEEVLDSVEELLKVELFIGRVPYLINWYELYKTLSILISNNVSSKDSEASIVELADACLSVRLLNYDFQKWVDLGYLPDIFKRQGLILSQNSTLFMLGHEEQMSPESLFGKINDKSIEELFSDLANQPFKKQVSSETILLNGPESILKSKILGTKFNVHFIKEKNVLVFSEMLLGYLESFFATTTEDILPYSESVVIQISKKDNIDSYKISVDDVGGAVQITICDALLYMTERSLLNDLLLELVSVVISNNFILPNGDGLFHTLYRKDELHERQFSLFEHRKFLHGILGSNPKLLLDDWIKEGETRLFESLRTTQPILHSDNIGKASQNKEVQFGEIAHNSRSVHSVINDRLWDKAQWIGFGFFTDPSTPLGVFLAFQNEEYGKMIFKEWIEKFGLEDKEETIRLSIVKSVDREHPYWYRVHIIKNLGGNFADLSAHDSEVVISSSRFHRIDAESPRNLDNITNFYRHLKSFKLFPAKFTSDGKAIPFLEYGISKREMVIKNAWEISNLDLDSVVIMKDDMPLIPNNVHDVPVLEVIKRKNEEKNEIKWAKSG